ncbi:hypothetical protein SNE40_001768 [Patella caerulea]|uniref:Uncharacterized protein n=1 Tax=Patella caerulea TaxID=87958 RepID=A0AAN8K4S9_PATCE
MAMFFQIEVDCFGDRNLSFKELTKRPENSENIGNCISDLLLSREINNVVIKDISASPSDKTSAVTVSNETPLTTLREFGKKYIYVTIEPKYNEECEGKEGKANCPSAFSILMNTRKIYDQLPSQSEPNNAKRRLFNKVIEVFREKDIGFTRVQVKTVGVTVVQTITNVLWFIDPHLEKFCSRGIGISGMFAGLNGFNDHKAQKKKPPVCNCSDLDLHIAALSDLLMMPWFCVAKFAFLKSELHGLVEAMKKYSNFLHGQQNRTAASHGCEEPVRSLTDSWTMRTVEPLAPDKVSQTYLELQRAIEAVDDYEPVWLFPFEPEDRYLRRQYIEKIVMPFPIKLYHHRFGNFLGNFTFVWKVPASLAERDDSHDINVLDEIRSDLPTYSTRAMRKKFIERYSKKVSLKSAVLRDIFRFVTQDSAAAETTAQTEVDERFTKYILSSDDADLLYDLRSNNGRPQNEKFDPFWEALAKYLDTSSVVHERRHGDHTYLPVAISMEDLREQVANTLPPECPVPSVSWLRMNFWPTDPHTQSASHYTGRFKVKYAVQQRLIRATHPDSGFAFYQFQMMKKLAVKLRDDAVMICLDDKAIVPVGEPGKPISTNVRSHNRSLVVGDTKLSALDHDFHIHGAIPSVLFEVSIPENEDESFYQGTVNVTVKDKVFQPSTALRHMTETIKILRDSSSTDGINLSVPVLLMYTDGGPDHRSTYWSVQLASILLFLHLDLDLLITARTAPCHSYTNPAERCMSLLNLGLQNVALEREAMTENEEFKVKSLSSMNARRGIAEKQPAMKEALVSSVEPVLATLKQRFQRLKLHGEHLTVHDAAHEQDISQICEIVDLFRNDNSQQPLMIEDVDTRKKAEKHPSLMEFVKNHCRSRQYSYQVRKCSGETCHHCAISPRRLAADQLHWLPDPTLGADGNYQDFEDVYGFETTDAARPGLKDAVQPTENDKANKTTLTAAKAREFIICAECGKRRVIFSSRKLERKEIQAILRLQDQVTYTCGSQLFKSGPYQSTLVVREALTCASTMETAYYAGVTAKFTDVCFFCGNWYELYEGEELAKLRQSYSIVRPLCTNCHQLGRQPAVRCGLKVRGIKRRH